MSTHTKSPNFGHKGVADEAKSYAEQLLTGKPVGRANKRDRTPKLKPRAKTRFGRKDVSETFSRSVDRAVQRRGWKFWATMVTALVLGLQALAGIFDWPSPTMGGRQLWTDIRVQGGWRVQCHAWTGHCRLLDAGDLRRTWGDEAEMLSAMDTAITDGRIFAPRPHAVVLVHGLGRSAHSFDAMASALEGQGYEVVTFNYASTRASIVDNAHALNRVVSGLQGVTRVSFVTHSLGGIVLRQALALSPDWQGTINTGRSVLLAAPNQGSRTAQAVGAYGPARWLLGPALSELSDVQVIKRLPIPATFATVAGTKNPLGFFANEGDGLVSVEETHLAGEAKHLSVTSAHTFIMDDPRVIDFVTGFIAGQ